MSDWKANLVDDDAGLTRILREARAVAVLGAKDDAGAPAYYVPAYLASIGITPATQGSLRERLTRPRPSPGL